MDMAFASKYRPETKDIMNKDGSYNENSPYIVFLRCRSTSLKTTKQYMGWDRE